MAQDNNPPSPLVEITVRIHPDNLQRLRVTPDDLPLPQSRQMFLLEVGAGVYRLGGQTTIPKPIRTIDVLREAGAADEVDELFLGGQEG